MPPLQNNILLQLRTNKTTWLFILAVVLLFAGTASTPMYILDEARNAQAAREMMQNHEWIVPTFNGELRPHKPPLHYYFMQAAYRVFGTTAFAARFFSGIMGLLTLFVTWYFTKRYISRGAAIWAMIVLLGSTHFLFEFRMSVPDPYLIFFVTAGLFCFYAFAIEQKMKWLIASAVAAALATLAKGPVALALPAIAITGWIIVNKKYRTLFSWHLLLYTALIVLISAPWYLAIHAATNGVFTREFFLRHNFSRFGEPMEGHGGIFLLIPLMVFLGLLPVSVFSIEAGKKFRAYYRNPFLQLSLFVTLVFIAFFSISGTKLPNYPMPCYPFIAVLLGYWINKVVTGQYKVKSYPFWLLLLLNTLLFTAAFIGLGLETATKPYRAWALLLALLPVTAVCSWWFFKKESMKKAMLVMLAGYSLFNFLFLVIGYPAIYRHNPVAKTLHLFDKDAQVYAYKIYHPAYNFYLNKPVKILDEPAQVNLLLQQQPHAIIISRESELPGLNGVPVKMLARERDLFETATTVVITGSY